MFVSTPGRRWLPRQPPCVSHRGPLVAACYASKGPIDVEELKKVDWRTKLSAVEYLVLLDRQMEEAGTGDFIDFDDDGTYHCKICDMELFLSEDKIERQDYAS